MFLTVCVYFGELRSLSLPPLCSWFQGVTILWAGKTCFFFVAKLVNWLPREKRWRVILVFKAFATIYFLFPLYTSFALNKQNDWIQKKMCSEVRIFFAAFVSESAIQLLANHNLIVLATLFHLLFFSFKLTCLLRYWNSEFFLHFRNSHPFWQGLNCFYCLRLYLQVK